MPEEQDPNTISLEVADEVNMSELGDDAGEKMSQEEIKAKVLERKVFLSEKYVEPHNKKARWVTEADIPRVIEDATLMSEMCLVGRGDYVIADAIAHTQINDEDPLRFFVVHDHSTNESHIIVNPVIFDGGGDVLIAEEGCMSFPDEPMKNVGRWANIRIRYQTIGNSVSPETGEPVGEPFLTETTRQNIYSGKARLFQHEVQHLNGHNIYDETYSITDCLNAHDEPVVELTD